VPQIDDHYPLWLCMDSAVILLLSGCFGAGILGAVLRAWMVLNTLSSQDLRITRIEAALTSEIKRRAAESRPLRPKVDPEEIKQQLAAMQPVGQKQPWDF